MVIIIFWGHKIESDRHVHHCQHSQHTCPDVSCVKRCPERVKKAEIIIFLTAAMKCNILIHAYGQMYCSILSRFIFTKKN